jgi:hypothetical protein
MPRSPRIKGLSLKDFAILISDYLRRNGIETLLSGGACVAIYTKNKYMSYDLDLVLAASDDYRNAKKAMEAIGFAQKGRYYVHKDSRFFIDFVSPPASVGEEPVKEAAEITKGKRTLRLLSVTDCVKDRLAAFYHWDDRQALEQAIMVASAHPVDQGEVKRWSKAEGMLEKYGRFLHRLSHPEQSEGSQRK